MFEVRCPYCGELLKGRKAWLPKLVFRIFYRCPHCRKTYRAHFPKYLLILIPAFLYAWLKYDSTLLQNSVADVLALLLMLLLCSVIAHFIPLEKFEFGDIVSSYSADYCVKCTFQWKENFKWLRYIYMYSGIVLPVCFLNEQDEAISHTWCASLKKMRHFGKRSIGRLEFVLDDAPQELLQTGNRFYVFYNRKSVAVGQITSVEFYKHI